jgi:hypothetical protein
METQRVVGRRRVVGLVVDVVPERRQRAAERPVAALLEREPAPVANGIGKNACMPCDDPKPGFTAVSAVRSSRMRACATPKKSPSGTSTDGVASPSHQQRRIASR